MSRGRFLMFEVGRRPGFNACFADGSARLIPRDADEQAIRALITRNGGEHVDPSRLE
jgi:prepilin-type processing-associated H-X9-DG protein